jgi:hypothetical protein
MLDAGENDGRTVFETERANEMVHEVDENDNPRYND